MHTRHGDRPRVIDAPRCNPSFYVDVHCGKWGKERKKERKKEGNADQSHRILPQVSVHPDQASPTKPCPDREEAGLRLLLPDTWCGTQHAPGKQLCDHATCRKYQLENLEHAGSGRWSWVHDYQTVNSPAGKIPRYRHKGMDKIPKWLLKKPHINYW